MTATIFESFKDALAIMGGLGAIVGTVFAIWWAIKRRAENKADRQRQTDENYRVRLTTVETNQQKNGELRQQLREDIAVLEEAVEKLKARCTQHQQGQHITDLRADVGRLLGQLEKVADELRHYKDTSAERFVTAKAHYNDIELLKSTINVLHQTVTESNAALVRFMAKQ